MTTRKAVAVDDVPVTPADGKWTLPSGFCMHPSPGSHAWCRAHIGDRCPCPCHVDPASVPEVQPYQAVPTEGDGDIVSDIAVT